MQQKVLELVVKTDKSEKNIKSLDEGINKLNKDIKQTGVETKDIEGNLDGVASVGDKFTGGLISGFRGTLKSIKAVNLGFKSMKFAIISTGIGALVVVLGSLAAAFSTSEEGQNKFNKLSTIMGAAVGNLVDLLADLGEKLISAFENPQQALRDFTKLIQDNLVNRFEGLLELIPQLGRAVKLLFEGEFAEAGKVAVNANAKVILGVENITEKVEDAVEATQEFIKEQTEEMKLAAQVADMRAKADKIERKLLVDRSKLESDIALLRLKARQEDEFSAEVRKNALLEAQRLEDQLLNQEKAALVLRRDAQLQENEFSRSNKENLDKAAQATAEVNRLVARRADIARTLQRELNTINNQIEADQKKLTEEEKKRIADEIKAQQDELIREEKQYNLLQELQNSAEEQEIFKLMQQYDKKRELALGNAELEKALTEKEEEQINAIREKFRQKDLDNLNKINEAKKQSQMALVSASSGALQAISQIAGEGTKIGKTAALADILLTTGVGFAKGLEIAQKSAAAKGPGAAFAFPIFYATQIAAVLNAVAKAKQIVNQVKGPSGGGGGGASAPSVGGGSQPPSFNVVGNSGVNQIAQAVGQQGPVQAFVVAGAVTNQQQLDNAIVDTATF